MPRVCVIGAGGCSSMHSSSLDSAVGGGSNPIENKEVAKLAIQNYILLLKYGYIKNM